MADEVLYQAGIDPRRRASSLDEGEARRVREKLRSVVTRAVGALAAGRGYPEGWLFHRRWGKRRDARTALGEPVEHLTVGGRTTAWVPSAQR
jgi:formamidopyrimidine-DNA glycosylase